jgi:hypothetical protein
MGIREEIVEMIQQFNEAHDGAEPTTIYLTAEDEQRWRSMTRNEAGGKATSNPRIDQKTIMGHPVVWGADHRHCE